MATAGCKYYFSKLVLKLAKFNFNNSKQFNLPSKAGISSLFKKPTGMFFCQWSIFYIFICKKYHGGEQKQ